MVYPKPPTLHIPPFRDNIRTTSNRHFFLVGRYNGTDPKPVIVRRSDKLATVEREYREGTYHIIDWADGTITFHFNGRKEVSRA
jgi:hypothetical protein